MNTVHFYLNGDHWGVRDLASVPRVGDLVFFQANKASVISVVWEPFDDKQTPQVSVHCLEIPS